MNKSLKKYWKSEVELTNNSQVEKLRHDEFVEKLPVDNLFEDEKSLNDSSTNRRDFFESLDLPILARIWN